MRQFICVGGTEDGRTVHIKHGSSVQFLNTGSRYHVYSEPLGNTLGVLVPEGLSRQAIIQLLEAKFPWFKSASDFPPEKPGQNLSSDL